MTVRINKPPIDLRSKLSELERPIGLKGGELMASETTQEARELVSAGRKNLIINGDMRIAQRGTSSTIDNNYATVDRWFKYATGDTNTWGQAIDPVHGYYAYWKANSSGYGNLRQRIEGFHIPTGGLTVTLSFWMKIDSGQAPLRIEVWNLTDNNNILSNYNIGTLTSSWQYYTITFNILSNVSLDTFHIMIGSNSAPAGTTFYLTKVQLEVGKNATEFEHRSFGEELALCQRYYQKSYPYEISPGSNMNTIGHNFAGMVGRTGMSGVETTGEMFLGTKLYPTMRDRPNITFYDRQGNAGRVTATKYLTADYDNISASLRDYRSTGFQVSILNVGTYGGISYHYVASAEL